MMIVKLLQKWLVKTPICIVKGVFTTSKGHLLSSKEVPFTMQRGHLSFSIVKLFYIPSSTLEIRMVRIGYNNFSIPSSLKFLIWDGFFTNVITYDPWGKMIGRLWLEPCKQLIPESSYTFIQEDWQLALSRNARYHPKKPCNSPVRGHDICYINSRICMIYSVDPSAENTWKSSTNNLSFQVRQMTNIAVIIRNGRSTTPNSCAFSSTGLCALTIRSSFHTPLLWYYAGSVFALSLDNKCPNFVANSTKHLVITSISRWIEASILPGFQQQYTLEQGKGVTDNTNRFFEDIIQRDIHVYNHLQGRSPIESAMSGRSL